MTILHLATEGSSDAWCVLADREIAEELAARNIFVWSGDLYAVEAARLLEIDGTGGAVRIGPVHYNTVAEIDRVLNALTDILPRANVA